MKVILLQDIKNVGKREQIIEANDGYANKGYTTEAVGAVVKWAAKQPNVNQIEAEAEESNPASIRVLEKCNFIPNGEMGEEGIRFIWKE